MTTVIKRCRGEKKSRKKNRRVHKKIMIPESEISECPENEVKSKIEKCSKNILLGFMKFIFIFMSKKKDKNDKNEHEYILFRIDVYFT